MTVAKANLFGIELTERLDQVGFWHCAAMLGGRLGARRIAASVYLAEAGLPIWPYHYHHGLEEWLYVIAGAPVVREPAGERALSPGDLVCFPSGPDGAHTLYGPGRFVIFATGQHVEPWMSVYPDSDKVGGPEGMLLRSSAVGYWHNEGTAGPQPADPLAPDAGTPPRRPIVNLLELGRERPEIRARTTELGPLVHAERLGGTVVEMDPLEEPEPYHYVHGREDWLLGLAGNPTMRHAEGETQLDAGDVVCLPEGPAGARRLDNRSDSAVRVVVLSTTTRPTSAYYPESGRWLLQHGPGPDETVCVESTGRV